MCLGGGAKTSCQRVLWTDGSASYGQMGFQSLSPCYLGKITECGTSEQRGWTQEAHSHCWAWMGRIMVWGSFHPGAILLQVEGMVARKSFSPLLYFRDNIASQYTVIISAI